MAEGLLSRLNSRMTEPMLDLFRRGLSNIVWLGVSQVTGRGLIFVSNVFLARTLGVDHFGLFALAQSVTLYLWLAVDLGTGMYGTREIAKHKTNTEDLINSLLTIRILAGIIIFIGYITCLQFMNLQPANRNIFIGSGLYLILYSCYPEWILRGFEKFKFIALGTVSSGAFFLFMCLIMVQGYEDTLTASLAWSVSFGIATVILFMIIFYRLGFRYRPHFHLKTFYHIIGESIHLTTASSLVILMQYLSIYLLSYFFSSNEVGIFVAPYRVISIITSIGMFISMGLFPIFSSIYADEKESFLKLHKVFQLTMILGSLPVAVAGFFWADQVIAVLFGAQYAQSMPVFKILIFLIPIRFARQTFGMTLIAAGFQKYYKFGALGALVAMLVAGLTTVPTWSTIGAAWSVVVGEAALLSLLFVMAQFTMFRNPVATLSINKKIKTNQQL